MPPSRSRKPRLSIGEIARSALVAIFLIGVIIAIATGWRPGETFHHPRAHHHHRSPLAITTPTPTNAPETLETASPRPVATPAPLATSISATPSSAVPSLLATPGAPNASPTERVRPTPALPAGAIPRVAIVIDDCGQWIRTERALVALPIPLTLSVLPDVAYTHTIAAEAAAAGKGVMLHLPMEPLAAIDPGPGKITTHMSDAAIRSQTGIDIAQIPGIEGVNNHEGSKATADPRVMDDVMGVIHGAGLFFLDSRTSSHSIARATAERLGVPTASRDVFLDDVDTVAAVEAQLRETIRVAQRDGTAIAIGHPRVATLTALRAILPPLAADRTVRFVLVKELVR